MKRRLFSITRKDFDRQTFSVGGHGGGGKDTSNSAVRLIHRASGAVGEGREARSNTLNERSAFKKLIVTDRFQKWLRVECAKHMDENIPETKEEIMARIDKDFENGNVLIENYIP